KSSISWKPSPPVRSVHKAMTRISRRLCFFVRSMRGSFKVRKCSTIDALTVTAMGHAPLERGPCGEQNSIGGSIEVGGLDHGVGHFRPLSVTRQRHLLAYHGIAMSCEGLCQ